MKTRERVLANYKKVKKRQKKIHSHYMNDLLNEQLFELQNDLLRIEFAERKHI